MDIIRDLLTGTNKNILNDYPDAVIVIDFLKNVVSWNKKAEEIFGYSKNEIVGKPILTIFPLDIEKLYQNIGVGYGTVVKAVTKDADEIFVDVTASDSYNSAKIIISARGVSDKFMVLQGLLNDLETTKKLVKKRDSFLSELELDFKNPLNSIVGFSQALLDKLCGDLNEKQKKYISIINANGKKVSDLISKVLDIIALDANKKDFRFKNYDLIKIVDFVVQTIKPNINFNKIEFNVDYSKLEKRNCFGDEYAIRQLLLCLLDNAVKFTKDGKIELLIEHPELEFIEYNGIKVPVGYNEKSFIHVAVKDTGIGIAKDNLNKIFNEFEEKDKSIAQKYGGVGLSLAIAKKIIEKLDGVIWVESELLKGSIFHFIVPIERIRFTDL